MKSRVRDWDTDQMVEVSVGDWVCFKSDIEQSGRIVQIKPGFGDTLVLENKNGFQGGYIGGDTRTQVSARDCWIE